MPLQRVGVPPRGGSWYRRELPSKQAARRLLGAPGVLAESYSDFFSGESSRQGKAGALWETAFPLLHPLPSPRSTPSFWSRYSPHSDSARLLGKATRLGSGRLVLPRIARAMRTSTQGVPRRAALTSGAVFDSLVSGGCTSKSHQETQNSRTHISRPGASCS